MEAGLRSHWRTNPDCFLWLGRDEAVRVHWQSLAAVLPQEHERERKKKRSRFIFA